MEKLIIQSLYLVNTGRTAHQCMWRFQDFFQGVAEQSSGGGEKIARYPPFPHRFLLSYTTILIYAHFIFYILDKCYKEIHITYFLKKFLVRLLSFIRKFDSPQV